MRVEQYRSKVGYWLLFVAGMVFCMVVVGGLTRLTHSGLSMVDWKPIVGTIPPITLEQWNAEFAKYQTSPEYQKINQGMSLSDFKQIFWFEYGHRVLGRLIGMAFGLPFLFFLVRKAIPSKMIPKLTLLFLLGGLQGLIGWWMVKSGLVDRPDVSHYRLTTHLGMAFLLFVALLWTGLTHLRKESGVSFKKEGRKAAGLLGLIFLTILSGGLMAGLSAGHQYNTFPLMNGQMIPTGLFVKAPWWLNFLENPLTIQFSHRMLAMGTAALVVAFWYQTRKLSLSSTGQKARNAILFAILLQVSLGISTLLSVVWVPLAAAHQAGGVVLISAMTWFCHELWRPSVAKQAENPRSIMGEGGA